MISPQPANRPARGFQALGVFFLSGGVLGLTAIVLPHWGALEEGLMLVPAAAGLVGGSGILLLAHRLPPWTSHPLLAFGTAVVSFGVALSGAPAASATYTLFFVWVVVHAAYFYDRRAAAAHLAFVAVCTTAALAWSSPDPIAGQVVVVVGILLVTWLVTTSLVQQLETTYRQLYEGEHAIVARLEEAERVKDNLLAVTSHELRTPLTAIIGYVRTLQRLGEEISPDDQARFLERLAAQSERMHRLVENLLVASGVSDLRTHAVASVSGVAAHVSTAATRAGGPDFQLNCPPDLVAAVSPEALAQILANLFDNAVKFAEPGTAVVVRAARDGDGIAVEVVNRGPGLPGEDYERVFEPFTQLNDDQGRRPAGLGLGLYVARRLAEVHGGSLSANGGPGEARFTVRLPAVQ